MLGCMIETSLAISAAAQVASLVDAADLDGPLLVDNDPFVGVTLAGGRLVLPTGPGLGVTGRSVTANGLKKKKPLTTQRA